MDLTKDGVVMQIAPGIEASKWQTLVLDEPNSPDWKKAIAILEARIHGRFIEPVDHLINVEETKPATGRSFGFAVLAIDCLLVETLGAFIDGLEDTEGQSRPTFCKFLTTRPLFSSDFTTNLAEQFYKEFRCGLLHQAEVGGASKVWSIGPLIQINAGKIIVNRNKFHERLKAEFHNYLAELRNPTNTTLRQNFRRKMDFICRN